MPRIPKLFGLMALPLLLVGCAAPVVPDIVARLDTLLPTDAILMGEQHDAPEHQRAHREVITALAARGVLAAVTLEMADQGRSTAALDRNASERSVREALQWREAGWNWSSYGPAVMTAVRLGVPVVGANLPRARLRPAMEDSTLDALLDGPAFLTQQEMIREGHCNLLPEPQVVPMTRTQIARDVAMAQTLVAAAVPGKTVVMLAGGSHINRNVGIPQHLPKTFNTRSILLLARRASDAPDKTSSFDKVWTTPPVAPKDYCADFKAQQTKR